MTSSATCPPGTLELQQHRDEARSALRAEAKAAFASAEAAENKGDFETALEQYRRAHQLDLSLQVDAPIQRVTNAKMTLGRKRCNDGQLEFSYGGSTSAAVAGVSGSRQAPAGERHALWTSEKS